MKSLFDRADRESILRRLFALQAGSERRWGTMSPAQMITHCTRALESGTGDRPMKQKWIGKILMPFFRASILGEKPFKKNSPTDPAFIVADERDFTEEREKLLEVIARFVELGSAHASAQMHGFFGRLSGAEWGEVMYKHIDHHLQQFGV